jgi:hypothetical protein
MRVLSPRRLLSCLVGLGVAVWLAESLAAQDVAITNVRIIVGNGAVVPFGTIIVRGGKIVSASAGAANTQNLKIIDANGQERHAGIH